VTWINYNKRPSAIKTESGGVTTVNPTKPAGKRRNITDWSYIT
jgi:hypothetical protein